jgi:hypothetical protein
VTPEIIPNTADLREYYKEYLEQRVMLGEMINFGISTIWWFTSLFESFVQAKTFAKDISLPQLPQCLFLTLHRQHSAFRSALFFRLGSWFVLKLPHPTEVPYLICCSTTELVKTEVEVRTE